MILINGQMYECEPAVEAYVKDLQAENEEQRREILRLTDELKEMDEANEYLRNQSAKDFENVVKFMDTIGALKKENSQLEESFQKATGAVAADALPTLAEMRKVSEMCKHSKCKKCIYFNKAEHYCRFDDGADHWNFGGEDNDSKGLI